MADGTYYINHIWGASVSELYLVIQRQYYLGSLSATKLSEVSIMSLVNVHSIRICQVPSSKYMALQSMECVTAKRKLLNVLNKRTDHSA